MINLVTGSNTYKINKLKKQLQDKAGFLDFIELEQVTLAELSESAMSTAILGNRIIWANDASKIKYEELEKLSTLTDNDIYLTLKELPKDFKTFNEIKNEPLAEKELIAHIEVVSVTEFNLKIDSEAILLLAFLIGPDEARLDNELAKLENPVTTEQILQKVARARDIDIFSLLEAVTSGEVKRAITLIEEFLNTGGNLIQLSNMFIYQFRQLLLVRSLLDKNYLNREIAKSLDIKVFVAQKMRTLAAKYTFENLCKLFVLLSEVDEEIKIKRNKFSLIQFVHTVGALVNA